DADRSERVPGHVVVDGGEDPGLQRATAERRQPETGRSVELALMLTCCAHTSTIGLADELCQLLPRLPGLLLEAGRIGPCGLEQKLLPPLSVDLAKRVVDRPAVSGPLFPRAHAASRSSTASAAAACSRTGRRNTAATTNAATSNPPRTTNDV